MQISDINVAELFVKELVDKPQKLAQLLRELPEYYDEDCEQDCEPIELDENEAVDVRELIADYEDDLAISERRSRERRVIIMALKYAFGIKSEE